MIAKLVMFLMTLAPIMNCAYANNIKLLTNKLYSKQSRKKIIENNLKNIFKDQWILTRTQEKYLKSGKVVVESVAKNHDLDKNQSLTFKVSGIHPNSCHKVLKTLSVYEKYHESVSFITKSTYNTRTKELFFRLESMLLPYPMVLKFKLPRINKPGSYPFIFETGIFLGLKGNINIYRYKSSIDKKERCLFYTQASWKGKSTGLPKLIIEIFSETLTKKSFQKLFRIATF